MTYLNDVVSPPFILYVEDDYGIAVMARGLLKSNIIVNIDIALRGAPALNALESRSYDLVIVDNNLPDMEGWEMLSKAQDRGLLRNSNRQSKPIIVCAASGQKLARQYSRFNVVFVDKPFDVEYLARTIREILSMSGFNIQTPSGQYAHESMIKAGRQLGQMVNFDTRVILFDTDTSSPSRAG